MTNPKPAFRILRNGFSLLEVIIATGILAASAVLLLSTFSIGEGHGGKAETRVLAQMLCQSKLDELLADLSRLQSVDHEPLVNYPDWTYSVDWTPTEIEGLIRLRVSVNKVEPPRLETRDTAPDHNTLARDDFELVRWTRYQPQDVTHMVSP